MRETGFIFRRSAGRTAAAGSAGCGQQYKYGLCKSVCVWQAEKQMGRILSLPLFGHPRRAQILRRQSRHGNSLPLHRRLVRNRCNYRSYFHFRQTEKLLHLKTAPELAFRGGVFSLKERDKKQRCALSKHSAVFGAANQIRTGDLVLTKDVLCLLSHSSVTRNCLFIIARNGEDVNTFFSENCDFLKEKVHTMHHSCTNPPEIRHLPQFVSSIPTNCRAALSPLFLCWNRMKQTTIRRF